MLSKSMEKVQRGKKKKFTAMDTRGHYFVKLTAALLPNAFFYNYFTFIFLSGTLCCIFFLDIRNVP